ncbi:MAG: amidohydrolase family protein [Flavobacteriaceae bacterium]
MSKKVEEGNGNEKGTIVIKNVNIIPMTTEQTTIESATVVINGRKIISINETVPSGAKIIDGTGKWLIPGLMDMHVHTNADINLRGNSPTQGATYFMDTQDVMTTHIANGVTTIFELDGRVAHFAQRNEIAKGKVIGPRMAIAPVLNGGDSKNGGRIVNNAPDARQAVRSAKAEGYNFIKVYSHLNVESFKAIVEEAEEQGLKIVGHIPMVFEGKTEEAFIPNFGLVAHAEEFAKQTNNKTKEEAEYFARMAKKNNTWVTPNLIAMVRIGEQARSLEGIRSMESLKYVPAILQDKWLTANQYNKNTSPQFVAYTDTLIAFHKELVKAFKKEGVPMVAGTDAGTSGIVTGFSLHDELALLVDAGMTNEETLLAATRLPSEWLGIDKKVGTVEKDKYADLVLLNSNPLEDIRNTRDIHGVFVNGQWLNKTKINDMLSDLANRNNELLGKHKWSKRREY